jgi:hypothetical protein
MNINELAIIIGAVGALLLALYGFMKYVLDKNEKTNSMFFEYVKGKDAHTERMSNEFTAALKGLSENMANMSKNDDRILTALGQNSSIILRAMEILKIHENAGLVKEATKLQDSINSQP